MTQDATPKSYWSAGNQVFFTGGYGWGLYREAGALVECKTVSLGTAEKIEKVLGGEEPSGNDLMSNILAVDLMCRGPVSHSVKRK